MGKRVLLVAPAPAVLLYSGKEIIIMYYIQLKNQIAVELIPEFDPTFPDVPVTERFSKDFLNQCVTFDEEVPMGYIYDPVNKKFNPPTIVTPEEPTLPQAPAMTTQEAILDKLTELEYRQDLAALGLTGGETA